jgi:SAM-dependent methyltransferase
MSHQRHAPLFDALSDTDRTIIAELLKLEGPMQRNYAWVYDVIAPWLGTSLLEVGSGVGVISKYLVARGGPLILSDRHPAYLTHLRARFGTRPQVEFQVLDLTRPPRQIGRGIDTIVCLNVLEHLADDRAALRALAGLLPAGGRLVLQVPNYPFLFGSLDEAYGHFRRYTRHTVAALLAASGFRVIALRNFNPLAIPGWVLSAKVWRARQLDVRWARLFNSIVPVARRLDFLSHLGGLALIGCAERDDSIVG